MNHVNRCGIQISEYPRSFLGKLFLAGIFWQRFQQKDLYIKGLFMAGIQKRSFFLFQPGDTMWGIMIAITHLI